MCRVLPTATGRATDPARLPGLVLISPATTASRHHSSTEAPFISHNHRYFRLKPTETVKMMKVTKKRKLKKRLKEMSVSVGDKTNKSVLRNVEVAGILSEIHPIAAGVYNHAYFVIIQERKHGVRPQPGNSITDMR